MSEKENQHLENTNFTTKKKGMHGCLKAFIIVTLVVIVIAIIGFSVCMATFTLDTK